MKTQLALACAVLLVGLLGLPYASYAQYQLAGNVVATGGGESSGGGVSILSTIGQPIVGTSGQISSGFWPSKDAVIPTDVEDEELPDSYDLKQNYPNPFNPSTRIEYDISNPAMVRILVFDVLGRVVNILVNEQVTAGRHAVTWDGRDLSGVPVASGLYLYRMEAGKSVMTNKMVFIK
jgi:FlgD Ig-like domain